ncbi:MAG: hypothetical protein KF685_13355, partial [Acidobacteria bacterium]|nr:hypothetical protein [Acidobacteriota bacterium]
LAAIVIALTGILGAQAQSPQTDKTVTDDIVSVTAPLYSLGPLEEKTKQGLKEEMDNLVNELRAGLVKKLETIPDLTQKDRENVMTNFEPFANEFRSHCEAIIVRGLDPEIWVADSLRKAVNDGFTNEERVQLRDFLKGEYGQILVAMLKEEIAAQTEGRESTSSDMLDEDNAVELEAFMESDLGNKFLDIFEGDFESLLLGHVDNWKTTMLSDLEKEMESGKLAEMLAQFMIDNRLGRP